LPQHFALQKMDAKLRRHSKIGSGFELSHFGRQIAKPPFGCQIENPQHANRVQPQIAGDIGARPLIDQEPVGAPLQRQGNRLRFSIM
jgi:hypothetical protein